MITQQAYSLSRHYRYHVRKWWACLFTLSLSLSPCPPQTCWCSKNKRWKSLMQHWSTILDNDYEISASLSRLFIQCLAHISSKSRIFLLSGLLFSSHAACRLSMDSRDLSQCVAWMHISSLCRPSPIYSQTREHSYGFIIIITVEVFFLVCVCGTFIHDYTRFKSWISWRPCSLSLYPVQYLSRKAED